MLHTSTRAGLTTQSTTSAVELDPQDVEESARRRIAEDCPYAFCFKEVGFHYCHGVLTLAGQLPSFYLTQVLQSLLVDLEGVDRIDNQIDVVSSTGLSSVRPK